MRRVRSLAAFCASGLIGLFFAVPASGSPQDTTLDAQIEHGRSLCAGSSPEKEVFGLVPPGFDYRFSATGAPDARPVAEVHMKLAAGWERSFRRSVVSRTELSELKREFRLTGSNGAAWLLASESQIDALLSGYKPGRPVVYEVALIGCAGSAGSFDTVMALKEFEVEAD